MRQKVLNNILKKYHVKIAYLFGSQQPAGIAFLDGEAKAIEKGSDLDIGVIFERLPQKTFDVYGALYAELSVFFEPFPWIWYSFKRPVRCFNTRRYAGNACIATMKTSSMTMKKW